MYIIDTNIILYIDIYRCIIISENDSSISFFNLQYTMLSGKAPFQNSNRSRNSNAQEVMDRIRAGEFKLSGPSWDVVSSDAKAIIRGEHTVSHWLRIE